MYLLYANVRNKQSLLDQCSVETYNSNDLKFTKDHTCQCQEMKMCETQPTEWMRCPELKIKAWRAKSLGGVLGEGAASPLPTS